jgi:hypothetical protein
MSYIFNSTRIAAHLSAWEKTVRFMRQQPSDLTEKVNMTIKKAAPSLMGQPD